MASPILLREGTVLVHDENDDVSATQADILIENGTIAEINPTIDISRFEAGNILTHVIDCKNKIISPGFIDTHHHVWQSYLKAVHHNDTLLDYMWSGFFAGSFVAPKEVFWSQLAGAMEAVDSGTTTVVDHAHINYSEEHTREALRATIASGIRSIFAYTPISRLESYVPEFKVNADILAPWVMEAFDKLAAQNPFGPNGRVTLAFGFDGLWLPKEILKPLFDKVRKAGSQLITCHAVRGAMMGGGQAPSTFENLKSKDLLGPDILLSHMTNPKSEENKQIVDRGVKISSTPSTELQMGHGNPVCLVDELKPVSSLGIDCHSVCSASIPAQMNIVLQWARARRHENFETDGKWANAVGYSVQDVYNLGTIQGARAVGMEAKIGSIRVGKKADLVVFDGTSPGMVVAAERDPVAAIVLHSSIRDIDTVIVDGYVRKKNGKLEDVVIPNDLGDTTDDGPLTTWKDVSNHVLELSREVEERMKVIDPKIADKGVSETLHVDASTRS